ncbi:hypothetical protein V8C43DRAFT_276185 [Trichoderma afarasin]
MCMCTYSTWIFCLFWAEDDHHIIEHKTCAAAPCTCTCAIYYCYYYNSILPL